MMDKVLGYVYGPCYLCTRTYLTVFCLCDHRSPLGKDVLLLSLDSWEQERICDHIPCFSPGLLLHTSYIVGVWGKIQWGPLESGLLYQEGCPMAMHLWHYCIASGVHTSSHQLGVFVRRYRESWKLIRFAWNYTRILVKHCLSAVRETRFVTVIMYKDMVVKCSLCPAEEDGSRVWGSCGLGRERACVSGILYHSVWKRGISALDNIRN